MFTAGLGKADREMQRRAKSIEDRAFRMGRAMGEALRVGAGLAAVGIGIYIKNTIEAEKVQAQLASRIKDTGMAAGRTLQMLNEQADKLQSLTIFDDESIGAAQAMLLTFKQVQGIQFDQAIESALDLSTVMGIDATNAAKLLGKALADPERGMGALSKAGVVFTDAEREVIKSMTEAGNVAGAQDLILQKLKGTMGSAAESARNTLGGALQGLKNSFNNLLEGDSGSDGVRGAVGAINSLNDSLNDPGLKAGIDSIVSGLVRAASAAIGAAAEFGNLIRQYQGWLDAQGFMAKSANGLGTRKRKLEAEIAQTQGTKFGLSAANDPLGKLLGVDKVGQLKLLRAELAKVNKELVATGVGGAFDGIPRTRAKVAPTATTATAPSGSGGRARAARSAGSSGSTRSAIELPDYAAKDRQALAEAIAREAEQVARANEAYLDLSASYGGPLAEAQRTYIKNLAEIAEVGKAAMRTPEEITALTDAETKRYQENIAGLEGMNEVMQENARMMDGVRGQFSDFFMDVFTGTKSVKDAFKDMANNIAAMITQRIVNGWVDSLFGKPGTSGSGKGGDLFSSIFGALFGGGKAAGGPVSSGKMYRVNENGPELLRYGGSDFLMMGAGGGNITPNHKLGGRGGTVNQTFVVQGDPNRRTREQQARLAGREARRAVARA